MTCDSYYIVVAKGKNINATLEVLDDDGHSRLREIKTNKREQNKIWTTMELHLSVEELNYKKVRIQQNNDQTHQLRQKQGYFHPPPSPEFSGKVSQPGNVMQLQFNIRT